jgi:hypothetical protein
MAALESPSNLRLIRKESSRRYRALTNPNWRSCSYRWRRETRYCRGDGLAGRISMRIRSAGKLRRFRLTLRIDFCFRFMGWSFSNDFFWGKE